MAADKMTRTTTARDVRSGVVAGTVIVAEGTALHRLQAVHDDPAMGVMAADLADVLAQCPGSNTTVGELLTAISTRSSPTDRIKITAAQVTTLTALLIAAH